MEGVINLNKPAGLSSQQAVSRVKGILGVKRAGHAGTLDPQATGVLVVCVGRATKITPFLMNTTKGYRARLKLGEETDTQDAWGKVVKSDQVPPLERSQVEAALKRLEGESAQMPPMYSALKVKGERLYRLARRGLEIVREPRKICVYSLALEEFSSPFVRFNVLCSSGTYVRTLCHDAGRLLGCGAHLTALERFSVGGFNIREAFTIEALEDLARRDRLEEAVVSMDQALSFLPAVTVKEEYVEHVLHGAAVKVGWAAEGNGAFARGDSVRVKSPGSRLLAVGEAVVDSKQIVGEEEGSQALKMKRVLAASPL